jgi:hypothetical protein
MVAPALVPGHLDGASYFDFAQSGDAQDWAIDPTKLSPLTKREGFGA